MILAIILLIGIILEIVYSPRLDVGYKHVFLWYGKRVRDFIILW